MSPIVAFAHCVCGIKLPLLSSQLPASNTTWLLCGDLSPPIHPFSPSFFFFFTLCHSTSHLIVYLCPVGLSHYLSLVSTTAPPFFLSSEKKDALLSSSSTVTEGKGGGSEEFLKQEQSQYRENEMTSASKENQTGLTHKAQSMIYFCNDCFSVSHSLLTS